MKPNMLGTVAAAIAWTGLLVPPSAFATTAASGIHDIALHSGGVLVGQVVDGQGVAKAGKAVSIQYGEVEVARTTTDENGVFAVKGMRGGQYRLMTDDGMSVCRVWATDTAPPAAKLRALVISGDTVVRGLGPGPFSGWVDWMKAHPYMTASAVAAGIAIPLVLADDDWDGD
jgi:hypothetical protein